jgi:hypothetical protein
MFKNGRSYSVHLFWNIGGAALTYSRADFLRIKIILTFKPHTNIVDRHKKLDVLTENVLFYCKIDRLFVSIDNIRMRLHYHVWVSKNSVFESLWLSWMKDKSILYSFLVWKTSNFLNGARVQLDEPGWEPMGLCQNSIAWLPHAQQVNCRSSFSMFKVWKKKMGAHRSRLHFHWVRRHHVDRDLVTWWWRNQHYWFPRSGPSKYAKHEALSEWNDDFCPRKSRGTFHSTPWEGISGELMCQHLGSVCMIQISSSCISHPLLPLAIWISWPRFWRQPVRELLFAVILIWLKT